MTKPIEDKDRTIQPQRGLGGEVFSSRRAGVEGALPASIIDEYIPPDSSDPKNSEGKSSFLTLPFRHFKSLVARQSVRAKTRDVLAKLKQLYGAPDYLVRRTHPREVATLVHLVNQQRPVVEDLFHRGALECFDAEQSLWLGPAQLAIGDTRAIVPTWEAISRENLGQRLLLFYSCLADAASYNRALPSHFVPKVFDISNLQERVAELMLTVRTPLGSAEQLREAFVRLMAASTIEEQQDFVIPALTRFLASTPFPTDPQIRAKRDWLFALLHGWLENEENIKG